MTNMDDGTIKIIVKKLLTLSADIKDLQKFREGFDVEPTEIYKQLKRQQEDINVQKEEIKNQKNDLIQYFGLFVAIFTAISIDIQLLRFAQNVWQIAGLMLMVNTAPLFFFFLIRWIHKNEFSWGDFARFLTSFLVVFIAGIYLISKGGEIKPQVVIERIESNKTEFIESNKDSTSVETKEILNKDSAK